MTNDILKNMTLTAFDDDADIASYTGYICWRVLHDFYAVLEEQAPGEFSWETCIRLMDDEAELRRAAMRIVLDTMYHMISQGYEEFSFDNPAVNFIPVDNDIGIVDGKLQGINIWGEYKGLAAVKSFFFNVQQVYFAHLKETGEVNDWDDFVMRLLSPKYRGEWGVIVDAFRDALSRLDYRPAWRDNEFIAEYMNR